MKTVTFLFCIKLDIENKPGCNHEKDLNMSLRKLNKLIIKSGFKSMVIRNIN